MHEDDRAGNAAVLPRRGYGYGGTGELLSIVGLGGVVLAGMDQVRANRVVAEAVERGVNYFDVAPTYFGAEERLGPALEPYRKGVFLACKTGERERGPAEASLKQSLEWLRTDYLDLFQLHGLIDVKQDVDVAFSKGGIMALLIERQKAGQIRHIGFSAHTEEAAVAAMDRFPFDSVLFPLNFACYLKTKFGARILDRAAEKGVARLVLKATARQHWPENHPNREEYPYCWYEPLIDPEESALALRWALSQPVTAAIPPGSEVLFRHAMNVAMDFRPVTVEEEARLASLAKDLTAIFPQAPE